MRQSASEYHTEWFWRWGVRTLGFGAGSWMTTWGYWDFPWQQNVAIFLALGMLASAGMSLQHWWLSHEVRQ